MPLLLVIAAGGLLGSTARFGVAELVGGWQVDRIPWATLFVNVVGCLAIGVLVPILERGDRRGEVTSAPMSRPWLRPFLVTGVLGGFTTVSALALETGLLLDADRWTTAVAYLAVTLAAGVAAVRIGTLITRGPG